MANCIKSAELKSISYDMILDATYTPTYQEIVNYIDAPARGRWEDINSFIQQNYKVSPEIMYSKCAGKPGWNVKYHKSGKALCTLYPEKEGFVTLVVVTLELAKQIETMADTFKSIIPIIKSAKPFNGTLWLMIPVSDQALVDNVKELLFFKLKASGK